MAAPTLTLGVSSVDFNTEKLNATQDENLPNANTPSDVPPSTPITSSPSDTSQVDLVDLARRCSRDAFLAQLNAYSNKDESVLSQLRFNLFDVAKERDDFPPGALKTRRKRKAGDCIENKLAADCHALCMFILGGSTDDIHELISCKNTSVMCTPSVLTDTACTDRESSAPLSSNIHYDVLISGLRADLLLVRSELAESISDNKTHIENLHKEFKSADKRIATCEQLNERINTLERKHSKFAETASKELEKSRKSINDLKTSLSSLNDTIESIKLEHKEFKSKNKATLSHIEGELLLHDSNHDSLTSHLKSISHEYKLLDARITDVSRIASDLKEPCDNAVSSLKGEFRILRQNNKQFKDDIDGVKSVCSSNKQSITNLRSRISSAEQGVNTVKQQQHEIFSYIMHYGDDDSTQAKPNKQSGAEHDRLATNGQRIMVVADVHRADIAQSPKTPIDLSRSPENNRSAPVHPGSVSPRNTQPQQRACRATPPPADVFIHAPTPAVVHHTPIPVSPVHDSDGAAPRPIPVVCTSIWSLPDEDDVDSHEFIAARRPSAMNRSKQFYVGNIAKSVGENAIRSWMENRQVNPMNIKILPGKRDWIVGVKLTIRRRDQATVNDPNFWPHGVYIREWEYRR